MQASAANEQMVDRLIAEGALWSPALSAAFRATPRHCFVDRIFYFQRKTGRWRELITRDPGLRELELVYSDRALITHLSRAEPHKPRVPISSSSQPSLMAQMLEDLDLTAGLRVLEIGAGTGYNAALIAAVVQPGQVVSIDVDGNVLSEAWDHLRAFPDRRVELRQTDGRQGWPYGAPYDRIIVTAANADLEPAWLRQLREGGVLLVPWNLAPGLSFLVRGTVAGGIFQGQLTRPAYFLPLRSDQECAAEDMEANAFPGPFVERPAPWSGWFERKRARVRWFIFVQSLAFYGLLRGLTISYRTSVSGNAIFGISQEDVICWFETTHWRFNSANARDLGWSLWHAFLDAGGPWPGEFRLLASADGGLVPGGTESYLRRGPRCQHLWELLPTRNRPGWL